MSGRRNATSPFARLLREPQRYRFDAGVRVLMRAAATPDAALAARFQARSGLAFPAADFTAMGRDDAGMVSATITVMGLAGPSGVLPRHYTETLTGAMRDGSRALRDFLDLLAHRMVAGFAMAGIKYRLPRAADTALLAPPAFAGAPAPRDRIAELLLALTGYGTPHLAPRLRAGIDPMLHYAGFFAARPRSADRLAALVSDWLGRPAEVRQFEGAWLELPESERTRMPRGRRPGAWNRLGVDAAIGVRAWDVQARIVLRVGPLDRASFVALLPNRAALKRLVSLIRAYLGYETGFAINPVLAAGAVPPLSLGGDADAPPLLGWTTWLPVARRRSDASEALFEAETVEAA